MPPNHGIGLNDHQQTPPVLPDAVLEDQPVSVRLPDWRDPAVRADLAAVGVYAQIEWEIAF